MASSVNLYWKVRTFLFLYLGYICYTVIKKSLSSLAPVLLSEKVLTAGQLGLLASAFNVSFSVSKLALGMLTDVLAPITVFALGLFICSSTALVGGFAAHFYVWLVLAVVQGLWMGACWAPCARLLTERYEKTERGRWWSSLASAKSVGGAVSASLFAYVVATRGWRHSLSFVGAVALCFALAAPLLLSMPSDAPNASRKRGARAAAAAATNKKKQPSGSVVSRLLQAASDPNVLVLAVCASLSYFCFESIGSWFGVFLTKHKGIPVTNAQSFAASILVFSELAGTCGNVFCGYFSDLFFGGQRRPVFRLFLLGAIAGAVGLHLCPSAIISQASPNNAATTAILPPLLPYVVSLSVWSFSVMGVMTLGGMMAVESANPAVTGSVTGVVGLLAYTGAAMSGYPLQQLIDSFSWGTVFIPAIVCAHVLTLLISVGVNEKIKKD